MSRFSRSRRIGTVTHVNFLRTAQELVDIIREFAPNNNVKVFTCEDKNTYNFSTVTTLDDEVRRAHRQRKTYRLEKLDKDVWDRSLKVEFRILVNRNRMSCVWLICDLVAAPHRLIFHTQNLSPQAEQAVNDEFYHSSLFWKLGNGHSHSSDFNLIRSRVATKILL